MDELYLTLADMKAKYNQQCDKHRATIAAEEQSDMLDYSEMLDYFKRSDDRFYSLVQQDASMRNETKRIKFEAQRAESLHKVIQSFMECKSKGIELPASLLASITGADVNSC
uniref:Uncharacterized protein n=1 Tax=Guillardia theta TaxID=55529 RepID=A0A7S4NY73_GUITH|mmetsp:Transcript_38204/g.120318  ORF Transcript_38204/g.120318 Transcript_38204/m.120318 type:complete len:112 (+) Transcript_38204:204-539(+)